MSQIHIPSLRRYITKKRKEILILLAEFSRFGLFTFGGGWSIIAQMQQLYVEKKKTITAEELLDLSRMDDGNIGKSVPVNMTKVTEEAVALLKPLSSEQNVEIKLDLEPDSIVLATENDLYHVVFNLVENAIKYNRENGKAVITVGEDSGRKFFSVVDNGVGIPADAHERVFERFFRVDRSHSRKIGGTGLGLSIVKEILKMHNFPFGVSSEEGKGSVFWFELDTIE